MAAVARSLAVRRLATAGLLLVAALSAAAAEPQDSVYAITDVLVTDNPKATSDPRLQDYTGISSSEVTLPFIPGQVGHRVTASDANRGLGGTTTTIWVKYERLPRLSPKPVLADVQVCHWVNWKPTVPEGFQVANGTSAGIQGALTTRTKGSVWRNGLAVRYMPLKDTGTRVVALSLSVTKSNVPPAPPITEVAGSPVTMDRAGIDIHTGGGGAFYHVMKFSLRAGPPLDPIANGITVLTYNTHLFKDSPAQKVGGPVKEAVEDVVRFFSSHEGFVGLFTGEHYDKRQHPLVFDDDNRARLIAARIRASGADIVGLQEVWAPAMQEWFRRALGDLYPYSWHPPIPELNLINTSGLVILSKYQLTRLEFSPFPRGDRGISDEDKFARKGVITATVEPWPGGPGVRLGISHATCDMGGEQQPDIQQIASRTAEGHEGPTIMMGDFNVHRDKYPTMQGIFEKIGAIDAYLKVRGTVDENAYSINLEKNLLDQVFTPDRRVEGKGDRLDYVFVKESGAGLALTPEKAEVIRDWNYPVQVGWWRDVWAGKWASDYVAVRAFQLNGHPHLFGLKSTDRAYISRVKDDGRGWEDIYEGKWDSNYVGTAITVFYLNGHPYIFALKGWPHNEGWIARINDDGKGWADVHKGKWDSKYVAVVSFQLNGHPYLFGLKENGKAYVSRINDDGKGWTDVHEGKWSSNYVGTAITTFYLKGHPYIFALKRPTLTRKGNQGIISRINDDGKGWTDIHEGKWSASYVAVVSFQLNGHPYLFGLKKSDRAYISRINDDGKGWKDVYEGEWSSNYVGTAITTFDLKGHPYMFALKGAPHNQGWITRLHEPYTLPMDLSDHYPLKVKLSVRKQ